MKKTKLTTVVIAFATILATNGFSQTGPAGVGSAATNAIWLDAHDMDFTDGSSVSSAPDVSGNGNDFAQSSSSLQPTFVGGLINGLPAIQFDGDNDALEGGAIAALDAANITYYIVFERATLDEQMLISAGYASQDPKWRTYCNSGNNNLIAAQYSPSIKFAFFSDPGAANFMSAHMTPSNISIYNKGVLAQSTNAVFSTPAGHEELTLGNSNNPSSLNYTMNGYIAELVVFTTDLNSVERTMVENYLGAKYNLTIPTDLYTHQATHNIELIGIGNDGSSSQTTAQGKGIVEFNGATDLGPNEFLLAAHTDGNPVPSDTTNLDIPASITGHTRFARTWRVSETGDVGSLTVTFKLSGVQDFAASDSYRLLVDTDGDFSDAEVVSGVYSSGEIAFTHDFDNNDFFTLAGLSQQLDIESVTTGDWDEEETWDCVCIPSANDNVTILAPDNVTIDSDAEVKNLTIEESATLTMATGGTDLEIHGNVSLEGSMALSDGEVSLVGTDYQEIDGDGQSIDIAFNDLEIDSQDEVAFTNLDGSYLLNGILTATDGELTIESDASFVVNSTSATTGGRIGPIPGSFDGIGGDVTVRRFVPGGTADWRDLATSVTGATLADWDNEVEISGIGFPDGCAIDSVGACFFSARFWEGNLEYNLTDINEDLIPGEGYRLFLGDDLDTWSATTLDLTGSINGVSDLPVSNTTGWNTVGNPYACPINYDDIEKTSSISGYFYIYDATTGGYQFYDNGTGLGSIPALDAGLLETGQGFWIFASSLGTLTFRQVDKNINDNAEYIRSSSMENPVLTLQLSENNSTYSSNISFVESYEGTDGIDTIDVKHLSTGQELCPTVAIDYGTQRFRQQHLAMNDVDRKFNLHTNFKKEGMHTFDLQNMEGFRDYKKILLFDAETNEYIDLKKEYSYTFYSTTGDKKRFILIMTNNDIAGSSSIANITELTEENVSITQMGYTVDLRSDNAFDGPVTVRLINILGQTEVFSVNTQLTEGSNLIHLPESLKGVHIMTVQDSKQTISKKLVF